MNAVAECVNASKQAAEKLAKKKADILATYQQILRREADNKSLPKDSASLADVMRELNLSADDLQADVRALQEDARLVALAISPEERQQSQAKVAALAETHNELRRQLEIELPKKCTIALSELNTGWRLWEIRQNEASKAPGERRKLHADNPRVFAAE